MAEEGGAGKISAPPHFLKRGAATEGMSALSWQGSLLTE
jgi:hypothetical protein